MRAGVAWLVLCLLGGCSLGTDIETLREKTRQNRSFTVTFNSNGGSSVATQTVKSGGAATRPANPTRNGYAFDDWYRNADLTTVYDFSAPVTGNITLYAKWNEVPPGSFVVTFNSNGGSNVPDQIVESGGTATRPTNPTQSGYAFDDWYSNVNLTTVYNFSAPVTEDITLYAKWNFSGDIPGNSLAAKLAWLQTNALSGLDYTVEVTADESIVPHTLSYGDRNDITIILRGIGANRTISLYSTKGSIFTVDSGVTLILENNITIEGRSSNDNSIVVVYSDGTFIMNDGSTITGNTSFLGGGVYVDGGTFTMNGGEISGNTAVYSGGGVYVYDGTFTMNGGIISDNTSSSYGGGVCFVGTSGIFTMNGGEISGNTSSSYGGGVYNSGTFTMSGGKISSNTVNTVSGFSSSGGGVHVDVVWVDIDNGVWVGGTFTMSGGEISGNTVSGSYSSGGGVYVVHYGTFTMSGGEISGNTASSSSSDSEYGDNSSGGGVCVDGTFMMEGGEISSNTVSGSDSYGGGVYVSGTFTKTGGTITGYASDTVNGNVVKDGSGTVLNNRGHAVYAGAIDASFDNSGSPNKRYKETTIGPGVNLSCEYNENEYGYSYYTWSGEWYDIDLDSISGLANKLIWLRDYAQSDTSYTIEVTADENIGPNTLSYSNRSNITITLRGVGANRIISLSSDGAIFTVNSGVILILDNNITLQGHSSNTNSMVRVNSGGTLIMNTGAIIIGNTSSVYGGGVYVAGGGTFMMSGGEISGNTGGGVCVGGGTFTMSGGKISGNTASDSSGNTYGGGGVYVAGFGTFTMEGGEISGNTASDSSGNTYGGGGGVYVGTGTFTMEGGTISGNTATDGGGGVFVAGVGTFTMSGGKISGNTASSNYISAGGGVAVFMGTFKMEGGEISGNTSVRGGGVYVNANCTFTMNDGEISGNTSGSGGGVYVGTGTFTMSGGKISGNTASSNYISSGGGVAVRDGTFTKTNGTIYGYSTSDTVNSNMVKDSSGNVCNDSGHAVYAGGTYYNSSTGLSYDVVKSKETTAGPGVNLSFDGTTNPPTWSGEWDGVPGNTLANQLSWLQTNAQSNADYVLDVTANESITPQSLSYSGKSNITITLRGIGANPTISLSSSSSGSIFTVGSGVTLVLDNNVTLQGSNNNTASLVSVSGTLTMNDGSTITGNTAPSGGGVSVLFNGTFTMNGGRIFGNTASTGGGVLVYSANSTFTMNGGTISGNTATDGGGGVYVMAGTFTKTNGTIYGYNASDAVNSNQSNLGHAVYVGSDPVKRRETTAGPGVNLDSSVAGTAGGWEN